MAPKTYCFFVHLLQFKQKQRDSFVILDISTNLVWESEENQKAVKQSQSDEQSRTLSVQSKTDWMKNW